MRLILLCLFLYAVKFLHMEFERVNKKEMVGGVREEDFLEMGMEMESSFLVL